MFVELTRMLCRLRKPRWGSYKEMPIQPLIAIFILLRISPFVLC